MFHHSSAASLTVVKEEGRGGQKECDITSSKKFLQVMADGRAVAVTKSDGESRQNIYLEIPVTG